MLIQSGKKDKTIYSKSANIMDIDNEMAPSVLNQKNIIPFISGNHIFIDLIISFIASSVF